MAEGFRVKLRRTLEPSGDRTAVYKDIQMREILALSCLCVALQLGSCVSSARVSAAVRDADRKMKTRTLGSVTSALGLYKEALSSNPDDPEIQLKTADAINAVMRIKTNANTILIEGSLDTPANKALWAEKGPEVRNPLVPSTVIILTMKTGFSFGQISI